jgi:hypothetical protein
MQLTALKSTNLAFKKRGGAISQPERPQDPRVAKMRYQFYFHHRRTVDLRFIEFRDMGETFPE